MRQGLQKMFLLSGVILVMGGCGNASAQVEDQMETLEESSLQQDLQTLINYEDQLQEDFETSLEGEDLSNFADSSAEVFTNVDERSAILENLRESVSTHESVNQELQEVTFQDDEAEIEDTVSSITDNLGSINGTMESFIPQYEEVLEGVSKPGSGTDYFGIHNIFCAQTVSIFSTLCNRVGDSTDS